MSERKRPALGMVLAIGFSAAAWATVISFAFPPKQEIVSCK